VAKGGYHTLQYGAHTELVQEVIDLLSGRDLLSAVGGEEEGPDVFITNDLTLARNTNCDMAWFDLKENSIADWIWTSEWHGRQERHTLQAQVYQPFSEWRLRKHVGDHLREMLAKMDPQADLKEAASEIAETALADLGYCAENRAFNGLTDNFWEKLFRVYRKGLWPCGWQNVAGGTGKFIAYCRPHADPVSSRTHA